MLRILKFAEVTVYRYTSIFFYIKKMIYIISLLQYIYIYIISNSIQCFIIVLTVVFWLWDKINIAAWIINNGGPQISVQEDVVTYTMKRICKSSKEEMAPISVEH